MKSELLPKLEPSTLLFPWGLPGLERYRCFTVAPVRDNPFFLLLQSEDEPELGLILVDPFPLFPEYGFTLTDSDKQDLKLERREDLLIYTTVSVFPDGLHTNLAAPLVINAASRLGKQLYLYRYSEQLRVPLAGHPTAYPVVDEAASDNSSV
ncbi:MAG: flagellar assembly protein FliW [Firmicutes bacterium]|nr:flagellar assembly protein FliW [Bacillota bacterium]